MKKLIGMLLIAVGAGMLFMLILPNDFLGFLFVCVFICLGCQLFRGKC